MMRYFERIQKSVIFPISPQVMVVHIYTVVITVTSFLSEVILHELND